MLQKFWHNCAKLEHRLVTARKMIKRLYKYVFLNTLHITAT